ACVRPAASVHPEPGSNSPSLYRNSTYITIRDEQQKPAPKLQNGSCSISTLSYCQYAYELLPFFTKNAPQGTPSFSRKSTPHYLQSGCKYRKVILITQNSEEENSPFSQPFKQ
ncbi:MAG: hypothetical protein AAGC45_15055, partial [Bacteroidota bacterium]